jgi:DNA-directed RNA polymerase subunit RPC12/RpoP
MARRSKLSPEQIRATLFTACTECGHKIYPAELRHVDGKRCRCPECGADFEPETKGRAGGGALPAIED